MLTLHGYNDTYMFVVNLSDVNDAEIFKHYETHASSLRDGRFDFGHSFYDQKFSRSDDSAFCRPGIYTTYIIL